MPFYYDGECKRHLEELGWSAVIHEENVDFFQRVKDEAFLEAVDFVLDNPPYTGAEIKERVLSELFQAGKPFALLMPTSVLQNKWFLERDQKDVLQKIQLVFPRRVRVRKAGQKGTTPFKFLVWICWKMELERDLVFLPSIDTEEDTIDESDNQEQ